MDALYPHLVAVGGILSMMALWIGVQAIWARTFPHDSCDVDVLAGRPKCCGCDKESDCEIRAIVKDMPERNQAAYAADDKNYSAEDCARV